MTQKQGAISSLRCSDIHTPLRGGQQATIYNRLRCEENTDIIDYYL